MEKLRTHEMDSAARSFEFAWILAACICNVAFSQTRKSSEIVSPQRRPIGNTKCITNTDTAGSYFLRCSSTFTVRHRTSENVDANAQKNAIISILAWCLQQVVAQLSNANGISVTKCEPQRHCEFASQPGSRWIVLFFSMELLTFSMSSSHVRTQQENTHACKSA